VLLYSITDYHNLPAAFTADRSLLLPLLRILSKHESTVFDDVSQTIYKVLRHNIQQLMGRPMTVEEVLACASH